MSFKRTKVAAVVGAALASLGVASTAQAIPSEGLVQSVVLIQNFGLFNNPSGVLLNAAPGGDFSAFLALDDASVSASLNGVNAAGNQSQTGLPPSPPADLPQATIGTNPYGQNNYTFHTAPPPPGQFARSDQQLQGVLVSGIPTVPPAPPGFEPTPASSKLVSEVGLNGKGSGSANTTSGTSGTAIFTLAKAGGIKIQFDANAWLYAQLFPALVGRASDSLSFKLQRVTDGVTVFQWSPDGVSGGITGGTEIADPFSLNNSVGADAISNGPNCATSNLVGCVDGGFKTFTAITDPLLAGIPYSLTFSQTTTANLTTVPEPGSLALVGAALLGLGAFRRWRV